VDHVAGNDGIGARFADMYRIVVDGVARRRDQSHEIVECMRALYDVDTIGGDNRKHGIGDPWTRCRIVVLAIGPVCKFAVSKYVARLRKGRHPLAVLKPRIPTDMVGM